MDGPALGLNASPAVSAYAVYGAQVLSDFEFPSLSPSASDGQGLFGFPPGLPPLSFNCPAALPEACGPAVFVHPQRLPGGEPYLLVYPTAAGHRLVFPGLAEFSLQGDQARAAPLPGARAEQVEAAFLSIVMALWLEQRGLRCLHAAAVAHNGRALAFLADSGQGKSSLAGACLAAGAALLSDDILPVNEQTRPVNEQAAPVKEWAAPAPDPSAPAAGPPAAYWAHPGWPRLGLWAGQAAALGLEAPAAGGDKLRLPLPAGAFYDRPLPLAGLFLLQRLPASQAAAPRLERLAGQEALMALVKYSFLPRLSAALGLDRARLAALARLAAAVPVQRLVYPSGVAHLPAAAQALLAHP